jgi:hypothetical protein
VGLGNRRELLLLLALFAALVGFALFGPQPRATPPPIPGSTYTAEGEGALALLRWMEALDYEAERLEYREFALDEDDDLLFVLNPSERYSLDDATALGEWVAGGGTLVVAAEQHNLAAGELLPELGVETETYSETIDVLPLLQPLLNDPAALTLTVNTDRVLRLADDDYVVLAGLPDAPVLVGSSFGAGYVYISSALHPFSNQGLRAPGSGALVLNILRRAPPGGRVLFDEYHHGFFEPPSARRTLLDSPWGQAAAYTVLVLAGYMLLTARRFGAPVPLPEQTARRSSAEYVESMAGLFQRAGQRSFVLRHFYEAFKRRLARPYGINPRLDDDAFVRELGRYREVDAEALLQTLRRMQQANPSDAELVRVVAEGDAVGKR